MVGGSKTGRFVKITISGSIVNTLATITMTPNPFQSKSGDLLANQDSAWSYVQATGGITSTTSVVLKAADSSAFRRGVSLLRISNAGTAGTEYVITDGASTVIYRGYIGAGANDTVRFEQPLLGSYAAAIQFAIVSATNVIVYPFVQGFTCN